MFNLNAPKTPRAQKEAVTIQVKRGSRRTGGSEHITKHKSAKEMLHEYPKVVESSDVMVAVVDREHRYLQANRAFLDRHGLQREEVVGHKIPEAMGEELFERVVKNKLDECFQGNVVRYEGKRQFPVLGERDMLVSYFPIEGSRGVDRVVCVMQDITERKRAEAENIRPADIVSSSDVAIFSATREGLIATWNAGAERMYGYTEEEIKGKHISILIPEDRSSSAANRERLYRGEALARYEFEHIRKDGLRLQVWDTLSPITDAAGVVIGISVISRDTTERKRAEAALIEERHLLHTLMDNLPDVIYFKDRDSRFTRINMAHAKLFGLSDPREAVGKTDFDFFTPEHAQEAYNDEQEIITTGQPVVDKAEKETWPNGRETWVSTTKVPLRDVGGNIVGTFGVSRDITERRRAEAERARLVTAIEQSAEGVVITNTTGDIEYVNPSFTRITGYGREEALGQNLRILKSGHHDPVFYQRLWATILRGEIWHGELINRRKDGTIYTEEQNIAPVRDARGEITHFIVTKQDVTERKRLEEQFRQAQKMEAVGRLAAGVAHDFNNLLTVINGYSALVLERLHSSDPIRGPITEIRRAGDSAASLTRQLLAFSRQQVLAPRVLDLNSLVTDVEKMLRRLLGEDIDLAIVRDPALGRVKADPGQIEQILMNLAVNARDAMPEGGKLVIETANIELDDTHASIHPVAAPGRYAMLTFIDTGIGMDAKTQSRIFEPFFTTKELGKGTGLGLATVYGIVKQSGGYIWVYSEPGRGSTFKIYLPRVEEAEESVQASEAKVHSPAGSETILIVEDDEAVRAFAARILQDLGYKVLESTSPEDALQIGDERQKPIDLLLTDVVLPGMSGRKIAERLTSLRPSMKVLYMSGYTADSVVRNGVMEATTAFLQKPFTPASLAGKVREVLDSGREESS